MTLAYHNYTKFSCSQLYSGISFVVHVIYFHLLYITGNDATAEINCEEQQPDEAQPQTQDKQLASNSEARSNEKQLKPEAPDVADRSSQSSFVSVDGTGKYIQSNNLFYRVACSDSAFRFYSFLHVGVGVGTIVSQQEGCRFNPQLQQAFLF